MIVFLILLCSFLFIALGVMCVLWLNSMAAKVRAHRIFIDNLDKKTYNALREVQIQTRIITNYSRKLLKDKTSVLNDVLPSILIFLLPFKKIKNLLLVTKLVKKFF